jgi:curved DNA-binding protein CbpA
MLKHYKILGIPYGASKEEIKSAFRKLVSIYHPDKPTGDLKRMQEITEAYSAIMHHSAPDKDSSFNSFMREMDAFYRKEEEAIRNRKQKAKQFVDILKNRS